MSKIKENDILEVTCQELSYEGLGVFRINNYPIIIKDFFPGEVAKIKVTKKFAKYAKANVIELIKRSNDRNDLDVKQTDSMPLVNLQYQKQIDYKDQYLINLFKRNLLFDKLQNFVPSDHIFNYRNKAKYPLTVVDNKLIIGTFIKDSNDITDEVSNDLLNNHLINKALDQILNIINQHFETISKQSNLKLFKEITLRVNQENKMQVLVNLHSDFDLPKKLQEKLFQIDYIINLSIIKNNKVIELFKKEDFYLSLLDKRFIVNSQSFFQVNNNVAAKLFLKLKELNDDSKKTLLDIFCGVGVISNLIANKNQKVMGIDIVKEAILDANNNAILNGLSNYDYYANDVFKSVNIISKYTDDSLTIFDPPRSGLNSDIIDFISQNNMNNIAYISCNPRTLIRDLKDFTKHGYKIKYVQGFDMFPNTNHIEILTILAKK
ncbi:23S rRNA (uracil(1939)-C(5))-methyltransferase RlmD [Mycoplasmopsis edwardii]|uniref:23S rRNA (Uracil(1939)-C(5))-methyltransferase RlmD n=1 Tax=Mycoplasmopsis edwardii TaxID=53558 RepID=A0ACD4PH02_9BACT|nr:23S rRNA (uracil(1939)-C(5))-methyltransferase RlmD [Mycoplasmopsis edwardii]WBP83766.1 23S rRNA (uracil(1939)-C(5))-methyltransferase RlmD [Mycoplasmopsis edwardii]